MMNTHIPNYDLYGEPRNAAAATGIHIEDIEKRSRGQDWVIKPHRHGNLFQVLCIFEGEADVQLDDKRHCVAGGCLVIIPVGVVHSFTFEPDSQGVVITLSVDNLAAILGQHDAERLRPLLEHASVIDMNSKRDPREQLEKYISLMRQEFFTAHDMKLSALLLLINLLFINVKRLLDEQALAARSVPHHLKTADKFKRLIDIHFKDQWQVNRYADELNVSTSTLNRMCQTCFGSSAKSIILTRVIVEAKRRLTYTQQPLDQIAYFLGYKDPAYFSRLFRKSENISPSEYRKRQDI